MLAAVRQHGARLKQLGAALSRLEGTVGTLSRSDDTNFAQIRNFVNPNESIERKLNPSPWVFEHGHRQYASFIPGFDEDTKKYYHERKLLGYSPEQMFAVVSNVENYSEFVPWCQTSTVLYKSEDGTYLEAELEVGFQVFVERCVCRYFDLRKIADGMDCSHFPGGAMVFLFCWFVCTLLEFSWTARK